jgi:hypothetical protein
MKRLFFFLTSVVFLSGCQKCYLCETRNTARANFCEGNANYDSLKVGQKVYDAFGVAYTCKEK